MNIARGITGFILALWTWIIIANRSKGNTVPMWATTMHALAFAAFAATL